MYRLARPTKKKGFHIFNISNSMADIDFERPHSLNTQEARQAVEQVAQQLEEELGGEYHWTDDRLHFEGQGASGHIDVETEVIHVAINLSAFLQPMKGRVQAEAEQYLDSHL